MIGAQAPAPGLPRADPTIASVQVLRAVAAGMVLVFHTQYMLDHQAGYDLPYSNAGAAGVDVFFVISGFIIAHITRHGDGSPGAFLLRRLIRVGPPYWIYTTLTLAILLAVPDAFARLRLDWGHVALSYLFVLSYNNDHAIGTLLGVGWTLCFEAYFYLLSAAVIGVPPRGRTVALGLVIVAGALLDGVAAPPFAKVVFSALPLEFLAGYLFGRAYGAGAVLRRGAASVAVLSAGVMLCLSGRADVVASELDPWRVLYFGVPAVCLVIGVISFDADRTIQWPRFITRIGDASYSLYLSHQFVLYAIGKIWHVPNLQTILPSVVPFILAILAALSFALLWFTWVERPIYRFLMRDRRQRRPVAASCE